MELKNGTTLQGGKYKIEKKLGQGSFGITYFSTAMFTTDSNLGKMDVVAKVCTKEFLCGKLDYIFLYSGIIDPSECKKERNQCLESHEITMPL